MKKIDDILQSLQTAQEPSLDEDTMLDTIMSRIDNLEEQPQSHKVIPMTTNWLVVLRNVSSIAAMLLIALLLHNNANESPVTFTLNVPTSSQQFSADATPGQIYAAYTERKEMLKHSYKQLIRQYNESYK